MADSTSVQPTDGVREQTGTMNIFRLTLDGYMKCAVLLLREAVRTSGSRHLSCLTRRMKKPGGHIRIIVASGQW